MRNGWFGETDGSAAWMVSSADRGPSGTESRGLGRLLVAGPRRTRLRCGDPVSAEMSFVPPGGESLLDVADRLKGWLKDVSTSAAGRSVAVVEPGVVRAMVAVVLAAPEAMQRLDVEPLSTTVLTKSSAGWRVRSVSSRGLRG